jgi:glycosyltransferase involved in cell wall biosynthesis
MKGTIIHNGIDVRKFTKNFNINEIREEFGIKPDQHVVGIIGRLDWWKGHEYFLEAVAKANQQISNLKGMIIGGLEKKVAKDQNRLYYQKLKTLIKSFNLNDKIIFTGYRDDIPRLMASLDVVVHASSVPEPFGLVVIEGMAVGKPVVATAAGGVLEIIENNVNGVLVPCRDSDAMAREISRLISKPDMAMQMGKAAQKRVVEKFTIQKQVEAVEKVYDSILANS